MEHYFRENEPHVFNRNDEDQIKIEFDRFVERTKGEIEAWSERGSGWVLERIMAAYVNVARYQPLRGGTYLPLPANLAKKKAIINVKNRDNECLKWSLSSAWAREQAEKLHREDRMAWGMRVFLHGCEKRRWSFRVKGLQGWKRGGNVFKWHSAGRGKNKREFGSTKADCDGARRLGKIQKRNRLPHL